MMDFDEIEGFLRKCGYNDKEPLDHYRVFYEYDMMDFLCSNSAKKYEMYYHDGKVDKVIMTHYWFGKTEFKEITTIEELYDSI